MKTDFEQQAMDGSPARVSVTLGEILKTGKFSTEEYQRQWNRLSPQVRVDEVISIKFQCGPIGEVGVNGCSIEDVLDVLIARLEGFQRGPFQCRENESALDNLKVAKLCLLERTRQRQAQGVEGTTAPHTSA